MRAWVGVGANQGDAVAQCLHAIQRLADEPDIELCARSSLYRTPPWGDPEQPDFINAVVRLQTSLDAATLLQRLQAIETALGRERGERRWGPRHMDLDLLLYGDSIIDQPGLQVPHSRLHERAFALVPLIELDPGCMIPGRGRAVDCLEQVETAGIVALPEP